MKRTQDSIANNFGLVGKSIRKYLATSALTATGLMAAVSPALADNWTDHVADVGSIGIDTSIANETNITQYTDFVKVRGDGDINAGYTVNLKQNNGSSRYVLFDTENDPTQILGKLNANGQVYIFDQNGVIFGKDSQVNVGGIVASTGTITDANLNDNKLSLENVGAGGDIALNGTINVAQAGLAAFVAPSVVNSGVINAKMGNVVLASGNAVTLDLYGDGLVSVAVNGELKNSLIENKGTIKAEGGTVNITASAAKDVVDNVINMDGVVDVSSVSVKGGKIILGGGNKGTVKVAGKLNASGTTGGKVSVTGQKIDVTGAGDIQNNGDGANTTIVAKDETNFDGTLNTGANSFTEISGNSLRLNGAMSIGENSQVLFDPATLTIGAVEAALFQGLLNTNGALVTASADNQIILNNDINTTGQVAHSTLRLVDQNADSNLQIDLNAKILLGANQVLQGEGTLVNVSGAGLIQNGVDVAKSGATVNVAAGTYNESVKVNKSLNLLGANAGIAGNSGARGAASAVTGSVDGFKVTANDVTIDGFNITSPTQNGVSIQSANNVVVKNNKITSPGKSGVLGSNSNDVTVSKNLIENNNNHFYAAIQANGGSNWSVLNNYLNNGFYGVSLINLAGDNKITSNDVYNMKVEGVHAEKLNAVIINGNRIGNPGGGTTGNGIHIDGSDMGTTIIRNNLLTRNKIGIFVEGANNVQLLSNTINHSYLDGVRATNANGTMIDGNTIFWTGDKGIRLINGGNVTVQNNKLDTIYGNAIDGKNVAGALIKSNKTTNVFAHNLGVIHGQGGSNWNVTGNDLSGGFYGINLTSVSGMDKITSNDIKNMKVEGIHVQKLDNVLINGNRILVTNGSTIGNGIHIDGPEMGTTIVQNNLLSKTKIGIFVEGANNVQLLKNTINHSYINAIRTLDASGTIIDSNIINYTGDTAIRIIGGEDNLVKKNKITDANNHGIGVEFSENIKIDSNIINNSRKDGVNVRDTDGTIRIVKNTINDSGDDGIDVSNSNAFVYIAGNAITNSGFGMADYAGGDGIHVENVFPSYWYEPIHEAGDIGNGEYNIVVAKNTITNSADDGVEIIGGTPLITASKLISEDSIPDYGYGTGRVLVSDNTITNSGYGVGGNYGGQDGTGGDGVHVTGIYDYSYSSAGSVGGDFGGYAVEVLGNTIKNSGDDGVEVTDGTSVLIANNNITNSGFIYGGDDEEMFAKISGSGDTGDYPWGADGIHVRNIWNNYEVPVYDLAKTSEGGGYFTPYSVAILNNDVSNSVDDGIQVLFSGDTIIDRNFVENSGFGGEERLFGGDGINVVTGINPFEMSYGKKSLYGFGYGSITPVNVTVTNNDVTDSSDDGIEVVGSTNVLVDNNDVSNSGDDGINVLGFAGYYGDEDSVDEGSRFVPLISYYEWPYFTAQVSNNTVENSGGDGIESRGFDELTVLSNDVTDSLVHGLYVSGFNNGYSFVADNSFTDNDIGAEFESGEVDLTGDGNTFNGGRVGLRFSPYAFNGGSEEITLLSVPTSIYDMLFPYPFMTPSSGFAPLTLTDDDGGPSSPSFPVVPPTNYGGTIGAQIFNGQSQYYVELDNGAFFEPGTPTWLNGLNSIYDGVLPTSFAGNVLPQAVYDAIEAKIFHYVDRNDIGLFFFGTRQLDDINQNLIFNRFNIFNGDTTGLNVRITGLPTIPGGGAPVQDFNNINTFAGGPAGGAGAGGGTSPADLNAIGTAAGGDEGQNPTGGGDLNNISTQAGGNSSLCWANAVASAGAGQISNVVYGGSLDDNLAQAQACAGTL